MASSSRKKMAPIKDSPLAKYSAMPIFLEKGLNTNKIDEHSSWRIEYFKWSKVVSPPKKRINVSLVREFYADMFESSLEEDPHSIYVRGELIPWSSRDIDSVLDTFFVAFLPHHHYEDKWRIDISEERELHAFIARSALAPGKIQEGPLTMSDLNPNMRAWAKFIKSRIFPTTNGDVLTVEEMLLLRAINGYEIVDWGRLIYEVSLEFIRGERPDLIALPFASLISEMCEKAGVEQPESDEYFPSTRVTSGFIPVSFHDISSPEPEIITIDLTKE